MLIILRDFGRPLSVAFLLGVLLIGAVASGVLNIIQPGWGDQFTLGVSGWFKAIPGEYYTLTGALALGYTVSRGAEKIATNMKSGKAPLDVEFEKDTE